MERETTTVSPERPRPFLGVERSLTGRVWRPRVSEDDEGTILALSRKLATLEVAESAMLDPLARMMVGRGVAAETVEGYLKPTLKAFFPDPSTFMDMDRAVAAILDAVETSKRVVIFADYDVDGATSAAQLVRWLRAMGAEAGIYVPDRLTEGYGPSRAAFDRLKSEGADLVITVDCGAMAHDAVHHAVNIGLDVVVIDHHLMREDPPQARAVVNPNRPGCTSAQGNLAAAGVVFVVLAALNRDAERRGLFEGRARPDILRWLDLAALGAICDVTPLTGFNRALTVQGLKIMSSCANLGIMALMRVAGGAEAAVTVMGTFQSGFIIGPRINAGGRVGRSDLGVRLLSTDDEAEAEALAQELDALNLARREVEAEVTEQAIEMAERAGMHAGDDRVVVIAAPEWHPGVIGIVAGRLRERWRKPVIVIGLDPVTGLGKGSGRSQAPVNLGQAVGAAYEAGLLLSGGGHAMAAGLSLETSRLPELRAFLNAHIDRQLGGEALREVLEIDAALTLAAASRTLLARLELLSPFGPGNPEPLIALADVRVSYASVVKGGHIRYELSDSSGQRLRGMAWRAEGTALGDALLRPAGPMHVSGRLKADDYMGRNGVQFELEDIAFGQAVDSQA